MPEKTLKARYTKGTLILFEDAPLKEGEIVTFTLVEEATPIDEKQIEERLLQSCGAWEGLVDPMNSFCT